jgi:GT2 family glycosyltransferase
MDLSIIIINYNTYTLTCNCLTSIFKHLHGIDYEIVVVDNCSSETTPEAFDKKFPAVRLISLPQNIGFGSANNVAMKQAKGKYFLLLNSDTLIFDNSIQRCFHFMESPAARDLSIGLLGCKILNPDKTHQPSVFPYLKNSLWIYLKTINPLAEQWSKFNGSNKHASFNPAKAQQVGDVSGAFMFIQKEIAERTGYFDTDFFMYCEDTEWCQDRIGRISTIFYFPEASIIHYGGQSAPQELMYVQSKLSLSLLWYKRGIRKYIGYVIVTYTTLIMILPLIFFVSPGTRKNLMQFIKAYIKLIPDIIFHIPSFTQSHKPDKKLLHHTVKKAFGL